MIKIILFLLTLTFISCNKESDPTTSVAGITYDQIAGGSGGKTWSTCLADEDGGELKYTMAFGLTGGDSYNFTATAYDLDLNGDHTDCDPLYEAFETETVGTFSVTAKKLYINQTEYYITPLTSDNASAFNLLSFCGFDNGNTPWVEDVSKLVTNLTCGGLPMTPEFGQVNATYHTTYIRVDEINLYLEE